MFKLIFFIIFLAVGYVFYTDAGKPYLDALDETDRILLEAGIDSKYRSSKKVRGQAITILQNKCTNGVYEMNLYDFRCASSSDYPYFK